MGREYVVQSWVKHDEGDPRVIPAHLLDDSAGYSGEQIGNRRFRSHGNTKIRSNTPGWYTDGTADLGAYADQNEISKSNPLFDIDPAYKILASYQDRIEALDKALHTGALPQSVYDQAVAVLNAKHEKASQKLQKIIDSVKEETEEQAPVIVQAFASSCDVETVTEEDRKKALEIYFSGLTVSK